MEDSKSRTRHQTYSNSREQKQQVLALFVVGLCAGVIISERLYIHSSRAAILSNALSGSTGQQVASTSGRTGSLPTAALAQAKQLDRKFLRSNAFKASSGAATVSAAALAGALAAEVAAAEAVAVATLSEQLVRTDPQLRELEAYLRKVRIACVGP